jgi:hypothetical protein
LESDARFYRRRANEELAAAGRAVTQAARERRMVLAGIFLDRLKMLEGSDIVFVDAPPSAFGWPERPTATL